MTTVYFVRHAKPNFDNHDDLTRELSTQGFEEIRSLMPWIVKFSFDGEQCVEIQKINVFG